MLRTLFGMLAVAVLGYGALVVVLYLAQDRLLFFPQRALVAAPADQGLPSETVTFRTEDGETLHGWWIPAVPERGVVLFFHGNAGNISHRLASAQLFHQLGLSVLLFDYRGYGRSTGAPSERGLYEDARAAWRYLTRERGVAPERIVLFGRSLGGSVASYLAIRYACAALILESTFTSVPDVAAYHYRFLPVRLLAQNRFDTLSRVGMARASVLVIHSPDDEIIPYAHGRRLYESAREPKAFLEIEGGHNDGFYVSGRRYVEGINAFLSRHL